MTTRHADLGHQFRLDIAWIAAVGIQMLRRAAKLDQSG